MIRTELPGVLLNIAGEGTLPGIVLNNKALVEPKLRFAYHIRLESGFDIDTDWNVVLAKFSDVCVDYRVERIRGEKRQVGTRLTFEELCAEARPPTCRAHQMIAPGGEILLTSFNRDRNPWALQTPFPGLDINARFYLDQSVYWDYKMSNWCSYRATFWPVIDTILRNAFTK